MNCRVVVIEMTLHISMVVLENAGIVASEQRLTGFYVVFHYYTDLLNISKTKLRLNLERNKVVFLVCEVTQLYF